MLVLIGVAWIALTLGFLAGAWWRDRAGRYDA